LSKTQLNQKILNIQSTNLTQDNQLFDFNKVDVDKNYDVNTYTYNNNFNRNNNDTTFYNDSYTITENNKIFVRMIKPDNALNINWKLCFSSNFQVNKFLQQDKVSCLTMSTYILLFFYRYIFSLFRCFVYNLQSIACKFLNLINKETEIPNKNLL